MDYKSAIKQITQQRKTALLNYEQAVFDATQNNSSLKKIDDEIKDLVLLDARGKLADQSRLNTLINLKAQKIKELNIAPPPYACKVCKDTGVVGQKPCDCAVKLAINSNNDIGLPLHKFSDSDFSLFDNRDAPLTKKIYEQVQLIINRYPNIKQRNIIIMGSTGTGKTFLAGAAASLMLENGLSVMAMTAFSLNNRFLKYHTTFDDTKPEFLQPLIDAQALIIDDLGTESILKNVTLEYFYQIINERSLTNKLTFITTNLSYDSILSRYGARIYSRLFDKHLLYAKVLTGKDLRDFK